MIRQIVAVRTPNGLRVTSPYGHRITDQLKAAGARWDANGRAWVVPDETADPVADTLRAEYGSVDGTDWVTVELRPTADMDDKHLRWGPWSIAMASSMGSPLVAGVAVVGGRLGTGGSRKHPTVRAKTDVALRMQVPRDWFTERNAQQVDKGWSVTEVAVSSPATAAPVSGAPSEYAAVRRSVPVVATDTLDTISDDALLREVRRRAVRAMDMARRTPGIDASVELDKLGTLLAALDALS
jgi:hypothetical protein